MPVVVVVAVVVPVVVPGGASARRIAAVGAMAEGIVKRIVTWRRGDHGIGGRRDGGTILRCRDAQGNCRGLRAPVFALRPQASGARAARRRIGPCCSGFLPALPW